MPPPLPEIGGEGQENIQPVVGQVSSLRGKTASVWVNLKSEEGDFEKSLALRSNSLRRKTHLGQRKIRAHSPEAPPV